MRGAAPYRIRIGAVALCLLAIGSSLFADEVSYNRDIRPILSEKCFHCHGPDAHSREGDLRLDTFVGATGGKDPAIVAGKPEKSMLLERVVSEDEDEVMPPPDENKSVTAEEFALLKRWIEGGAEYEAHWAFDPPSDPFRGKKVKNAIDRLVENELSDRGLEFSPEADRHTLIRRVSFDLTGLPPTPALIRRYTEDWDYEALVDELLASPAYGEHRARYWLDAARYGDTHGLHFDGYREMWPYRDWVIEAYNANMPFDQFTVEQIAGDLLPNPTQDQLIATGFNRCNVTTNEGGSIDEEFLARYAVDRVSTTATVWLGLTAGCAQCHDHKFDPISMREFYQLYAFFNHTTQQAMDKNAADTPPSIRVFEDEAHKRRALDAEMRHKQALNQLKRITREEGAAFDAWVKAGNYEEMESWESPDMVLDTLLEAGIGEALTFEDLGQFSLKDPFTILFHFDISASPEKPRYAIASQLDPDTGKGWEIAIENGRLTYRMVEEPFTRYFQIQDAQDLGSRAKGWIALAYDGSGLWSGFQIGKNGQLLTNRRINRSPYSIQNDFASDAPMRIGLDADVSGLRIYDRPIEPRELTWISRRDELLEALKNGELVVGKVEPSEEDDDDDDDGGKKKSPVQRNLVQEFYASIYSPAYQSQQQPVAEALREKSLAFAGAPSTLIMEEQAGRPKAHVLERGEYDQLGEEVQPGFPAFVEDVEGIEPRNRLSLAEWIVHPNHPLTARVIVNRMWQELFGVGLVKTSEDLGTQSEAPSHPELLDWLAVDFVRSGWDVKAFFRKVVMSRTYRQRSSAPTERFANDPENRWLARGPRFRLDAESIRDQALMASGLLDATVGGPSVRPFQPYGVWKTVGLINSNTQIFTQDYGQLYEHRRSVYSFWKRTAPPPNLAMFDAPAREECTVRRERTNTPLQALVLLNDPQYVRAARFLALRAMEQEDESEGRLDYLSLVLRGRGMKPHEAEVALRSLDAIGEVYRAEPQEAERLLVDPANPVFSGYPESVDPVELASWSLIASQMMNLDETLTKN